MPCKACAGFDAEVAKGSEGIERLAREKFVSLRQVEMKGVDLSQFQFDYDLNWAAMFINADGTVYGALRDAVGRGAGRVQLGRVAQADDGAGAGAAREVRKGEGLAGRQARRKTSRTRRPWKCPGWRTGRSSAGPTARNNCIHCHMVHDAEQNQWLKEGTMPVERLYR